MHGKANNQSLGGHIEGSDSQSQTMHFSTHKIDGLVDVAVNFFQLNFSVHLFLCTLPHISIHKNKGKLKFTVTTTTYVDKLHPSPKRHCLHKCLSSFHKS